MTRLSFATAAFAAAMLLAGGNVMAANMCRTQQLTCATTMPVGGYCECTAHGNTQSGTVTAATSRGERPNATAGGCGAHPHSPGCS